MILGANLFGIRLEINPDSSVRYLEQFEARCLRRVRNSLLQSVRFAHACRL